MPQPISTDELATEAGFGGCPTKGQQFLHMSPMSTPFSQASSAPVTPNLSALPDPLHDHGSPRKMSEFGSGFHKFTRMLSSDSTIAPESVPTTPLMSLHPDPFHEQGTEFSRPFGSLSSESGWGGFASFSRKLSSESAFSSYYAADVDHRFSAQGSFPPLSEEAKLTPDHDSDMSEEDKVDELEELLDEVKNLYNEKFPADHIEDAGHEVGCDEDGLVWEKYTGQGRSQAKEEQLQDLLDEVKGLYNSKYPLDHVDDEERDIGCDAEGLTWVEYTGPGVQRSKVEQVEDLLDEVKGLYNEKYPLDHVDDEDREIGYDADGLPWVKYVGQGIQTHDAKVDKLQVLLEEVKGLYNEKYPSDHVDDEGREVGTDEDGLLWVRYTGDGIKSRHTQAGELEELLEEVKQLYNEKYPLDHVEEVGQEVGRDADGLLWVQYTGQGIETQEAKVDRLMSSLEDVKALYNQKFPQDHVDDVEGEAGVDADGLHWVSYTGRGTEAREAKMDELFDLLEEVKGAYNERYPLDHVDDAGYEVGRDVDGLFWTKYTGQGVEGPRAEVDELEGLLQEVKSLYNQKYPHDHVDDESREVGRDGDGMLWVRYTGRRSEIQETKMDDLLEMLEEVKGLYNGKYPLDHVDDTGCEMGYDADGLQWVQHTGQGVETRTAKIETLEDLLEEVKGLYNQKYPQDHADDAGREVGYDADGLLWVKYTGRTKMDDLQDLLDEVKGLYNEKYPLDHVDDSDREVGHDADGLMWVKYTGQGTERGQAERLEDMLQEVKSLYNKKYPEDCVDDVGCETGYDEDGLLWVKHTGQGVERSQVDKLEDLLEEVKGLYNEKYPDDHVDDKEYESGYDADGLLWLKYTGQGAKTWDMKVDKLEDMLEEVKGLYNERYPQDHADDEDREVGTDADGLLWVRYTGHSAETAPGDAGQRWATLCDGLLQMQQRRARETRECKMDKLTDLLQEVKGMYNKKYPLDHVDDMAHEAGTDGDGLLWVKHTGQGIETWEQKVEPLEDLLEEVRGLYNHKYPLDHVDDADREVGLDSDGLHWVQYTGDGGRGLGQIEKLQDLLQEVKGLYSAKYPLDDVDDAGREVGYDADGLLWVKHTGQGVDAHEEAQEQPEGQSKMDQLQKMLDDVAGLYNQKYPLDNVDDLGREVGYDADGMLWVKYTGQGAEKEVATV